MLLVDNDVYEKTMFTKKCLSAVTTKPKFNISTTWALRKMASKLQGRACVSRFRFASDSWYSLSTTLFTTGKVERSNRPW